MSVDLETKGPELVWSLNARNIADAFSMPLVFYRDDVDQLIPLYEAAVITERCWVKELHVEAGWKKFEVGRLV